MPEQPISDDALVEIYQRTGSQRAVMRETGLPWTTVRRRLKRLSEEGRFLGEQAMPGYTITRVNDGPVGRSVEQRPERGAQFEVPAGHVVKGVSVYTDPDGRIIGGWTKTREGERDPAETARLIKIALNGVDAAPPAAAPRDPEADLCNLIPLADWHVGLHAWGKEVGENWDLKIAEEKIGAAVDAVLARAPEADTGVVLGGGDLTHSDDRTNTTPASKHPLQVDGRYPKVVTTAIRLVARTVDRALQRHRRVVFRALEGNHDPHAHVAVTYAIAERYRNEPRVEVDLSPSLFWHLRFGDVMLAATHGHTLKGPAAREMPMLMAAYWPETWGATRYRFAHTFHLHHKEKHVDEHGGVETHVHQAPVPRDVFAYGGGYVAGRTLRVLTYHRTRGERSFAAESIA